MRAKKRTTVVHSHQMRVRVSKKNPSGLTIRDQHIRRLSGTDVIKALIASESNFKENPTPRKIAIGITQITKSTLKVIQDPNGESKDFIFNKITQKDLKDPNIAIPLGVRWLMYKKTLARHKLKREPTVEEIILEYKGLLKSTSKYQNNALENFRVNYGLLKRK